MRRPLVAGNWKMHGSRAQIRELLDALVPILDNRAEVLLLPPATYLSQVVERVAGTAIRVGAQNVHGEKAGAFTGEVAAEMVRDLGASFALVGHSERRTLCGETDTVVAAKFAAVQRAAMVPILCVGESLAEREAGRAEAVVIEQLEAVIDTAGVDAFASAVVAYEPVWAIGTGRTAAAADAQAMHAVIRARVADERAAIGAALRVLYGGSVKAANAGALFRQPDIDGGLVGGASLDAREFARICNAV